MKERACGECEEGIMQEAIIDHIVERQDRPTIKIHKVKVNQCTECGRVAFPRTSSQYIEKVIRDEDETISSDDLEIFRNNTGCTQDELSEILGLGDKTFHRWEKGSHYPSRSMGYYIRILAEFPDAFDWLTNRGWRNKSLHERSPRWN
jgi:putative zinc finger/helix-turn-helix YgiT family protein